MTRSRISAVPLHAPRAVFPVAALRTAPNRKRWQPAAMSRVLCTSLSTALLALCTMEPANAAWSQIAYIPANQVNVYYDRDSVTTEHGLTRAWFMFSYSRPMTSAEGFVFKSYKQLEVIDCKQRGSFTATFTAFSEADGGGRTIYVWNSANAVMPQLNPAVPGSVRALMDDAACAPPPASVSPAAGGAMVQPGSPMPAGSMPTNTQSSPMGTPGQTTATPLR